MSNYSLRRHEILDVALALGEEAGVANVTTTALATRMGFTEAALYRYFTGKTAILAAMLHRVAEDLFAAMAQELAAPTTPGAPSVVAQLEAHAQRFETRRGLLLELLLFAATSRAEQLLETGRAILDEYTGRMATFFAQAGQAQLLAADRDSEELARLWVCQLLGGFLHQRLASQPWSPHTGPGFRAFVAQLR